MYNTYIHVASFLYDTATIIKKPRGHSFLQKPVGLWGGGVPLSCTIPGRHPSELLDPPPCYVACTNVLHLLFIGHTTSYWPLLLLWQEQEQEAQQVKRMEEKRQREIQRLEDQFKQVQRQEAQRQEVLRQEALRSQQLEAGI